MTRMQEFMRRHEFEAARFWSRADQSGGSEACWQWRGWQDVNGYGRFTCGSRRCRSLKSMLPHRIAYGLSTGDMPAVVCHKCDNPSCVNPAHLFGGTQADNLADMRSKGRQVRGSAHGMARLDERKVLEMRSLAKAGVRASELSAKFGVSAGYVSEVVSMRKWAHLPSV